MRGFVLFLCLLIAPLMAAAHSVQQTKGDFEDRFRQLDEVWPTPSEKRNASGAPGPEYWQQKVDYVIEAVLDDAKQRLSGTETITYTNNSPDQLRYLWMQMDQNLFQPESKGNLSASFTDEKGISYRQVRKEDARQFEGGFRIKSITAKSGDKLNYTVVDTHMRIDLPQALESGQRFEFTVTWDYAIPDIKAQGSRGGYEYFDKEDNYIYTMSQWYPRMAAYTDHDGWVLQPFLGAGEYALEFGDFDVAITVPADHVVAATGELQNPDDVLTQAQQERLEEARTADRPVLIITEEEAIANESAASSETNTWRFKATNVRDFAFGSSRKFLWDAQGVAMEDGHIVMAMSFYPKEGNPLWGRYSTHAIIHTLEVFSRFTIPYPYPVAQAVNSPSELGMEYPMISFNSPRPDEPNEEGVRTYSRKEKYNLIGVIIHETGHNYFPMIINSNERRWGWMDEGLNSFVSYLAEVEWEEAYPSWSGPVDLIADYMLGDAQTTIMTQPDAVIGLGANAYDKVTTALIVLREGVLGRELFDFAFQEYAQRWAFKRPNPSDFFRTMEDASGVDLDWFWRGWFYSTDHVDIGITDLTRYALDSKNPDVEFAKEREEDQDSRIPLTQRRNKGVTYRVDRFPELKDFYNENDAFTVSNKDRNEYQELLDGLEEWEQDILQQEDHFYVVDLTNHGGLVSPVTLEIIFLDGTIERLKMPAEIWRRNHREVKKLIITEQMIDSIQIDPDGETADLDITNNHFPQMPSSKRLDVYKDDDPRNLMKDIDVELKASNVSESITDE